MLKTVLKVAVTALAGSILALSGWALTSVADLPKEYQTKTEAQRISDKNDSDHKEIIEKLDDIRALIFKLHVEKEE